MKGKILLALLLGAGVAVAQAQEQQPGMPNSAPTTSPSGTTNDPSAPKAKQQAPVDQTESHTASSGTVAPTAPSTSVKGCLKQTGGGWTLLSDSGNTINVTGDDSALKGHDAQQVEIMGTQANDGSIQATSVNMIANSCPNQSGSTASTSPAAPAATGANTAQDTTQSTTTETTQTTQQSATTTASAPVTDQTPATSVGTGSTAANGTAANMNGQNAAQTPATSPAAPAPDQSAAQQTPSSTTTDQNSASTSTSSMNQNDKATTDQNANANAGTDNNAAGQKLPQTASPLPLLVLLGLGSLAGGFFTRKKK